MLTHLTPALSLPDAEEEMIEVKSEDDPQCVVHYPELMPSKPSRIILLSDRSYAKLIECKNIRMDLGAQACHDQCETIPVPNYDTKRDGYHRPCYMRFVKITAEDIKASAVETCAESQAKTQDERRLETNETQNESCSDRNETEVSNRTDEREVERKIQTKTQDESSFDNNETQDERRSDRNDSELSNCMDQSETESKIPEKPVKTKRDDYSGDSKTKPKNFIDRNINGHAYYSDESKTENGNHGQSHSGVQNETTRKNYFDHTKNFEHKNSTDQRNRRMRRRHSEIPRKTSYREYNGFQND